MNQHPGVDAPHARSGIAPDWRSSDLRLDDLIHELSADELEELEAALRALEQRGGNYLDATAQSTPMPGFDATLEHLYLEVRDGAGFVMFRGLPVERYTKDQVRALAWILACRFGRPVSQNAKGARIADVMDTLKGVGSPRGYHSNAELRPHTDPASDLIGLCCIEAAKSGGDSMLANALAVHDAMKAQRPDLLEVLYQGFPYHRFGEGLVGDAEITEYDVPLLSIVDGKVSCRYGNNRIDGAAKALNTPLGPKAREALDMFAKLAASPEFSITFRMRPGDFLIVNNLTLLHARTNFVDNDDPARPRHLLRFWLEGQDFRPIDPALNFFNRGACGILEKAGA